MTINYDAWLEEERIKNEPEEVGECEFCGGEIYKGNTIYEFLGADFCSMDCIYDHVKSEVNKRIAGDE